jgi:hypothetical protein
VRRKTEETKMSTKPTHEAYVVVGDGEKARWTKIGVGFARNDAMTILSDVLPTGKLVVRPITPAEKGGAQ